MGTDIHIYRWTRPHPFRMQLWLLLLVPSFFFAMAIMVIVRGDFWPGMVITTIALVATTVSYVTRHMQRIWQAPSVEIDEDAKAATFVNCRFVVSFWPPPVSPRVVMPFSGMLDAKMVALPMKNFGLKIDTTNGQVIVLDLTEGFYELRETIGRVIVANKADRKAYSVSLLRKPVIRMPWYVWVVFIAGLTVAGVAIFRFVVYG